MFEACKNLSRLVMNLNKVYSFIAFTFSFYCYFLFWISNYHFFVSIRLMSKQQRPSGQTNDGSSISSKLLGANLSDINIEKFRDLTQYQKDTYHLSGKLTIPILKTITNKFAPEVIFTINLPNQAIGSIECLAECTNLIVINLSRNSIEDLSPLKVITTLKIVNFS